MPSSSRRTRRQKRYRKSPQRFCPRRRRSPRRCNVFSSWESPSPSSIWARKKWSICRPGRPRNPGKRASRRVWSNARWEGFRRLDVVPALRFFKRLDRACLVEVEDGIELLRHVGEEVMTDALRLRPINHTDRPLESRLGHERTGGGAVSEIQEEARTPGLLEPQLVTVRNCRTDAFALARI